MKLSGPVFLQWFEYKPMPASKRFMCAGIEPGHSSSHDLYFKLVFIQVQPVKISNFQFTSC